MTIIDASLVRLLGPVRDKEDEDRLRSTQEVGAVLRDSLLRAHMVIEAGRRNR